MTDLQRLSVTCATTRRAIEVALREPDLPDPLRVALHDARGALAMAGAQPVAHVEGAGRTQRPGS
jgi:hypothetical protein